MSKLILFYPAKGQLKKYREATATTFGESFYLVANAGGERNMLCPMAEYRWSDDKPQPDIGYRLTEDTPEEADCFRDSGWEVSSVEEYSSSPGAQSFGQVIICYCEYRPLSAQETLHKSAHRLPPSLASFGGDEESYERWKELKAKHPVEV